MGLYLCVFDSMFENELEGVEIGSYDHFGYLRDTVEATLENGDWGSRFPVFMNHSDCDGEWPVSDLESLRREIVLIQNEFSRYPPTNLKYEWQRAIAKSRKIHSANLAECFIDIDGEPLFNRLLSIIDKAIMTSNPIIFQ